MSYSQNDEEAIVTGYFEKIGVAHGRFLDIGAYDGKAFSNTMRLVELGWGGVCVEPSPSVFPALLKLHGGNANIELCNAAVCPDQEPRMVEFFDSGGDALSTTNVNHVKKWEAGWNCKFQKFYVYMLPLAQLFIKFGCHFEFINIDVEATNFELFLELPFCNLDDTRVICIEHDGHEQEMAARAGQWGFKAIARNGENLILAR